MAIVGYSVASVRENSVFLGFLVGGGVGVGRGEALVGEPVWAADGRDFSSMASSLCHS